MRVRELSHVFSQHPAASLNEVGGRCKQLTEGIALVAKDAFEEQSSIEIINMRSMCSLEFTEHLVF